MIHLSPNKNGIFSKKGASPLSKYFLFFIYRKLIPICLQKTITTLTKLYQLMITLPKVLPLAFSLSRFLSLSLSLFLSVPYSLSPSFSFCFLSLLLSLFLVAVDRSIYIVLLGILSFRFLISLSVDRCIVLFLSHSRFLSLGPFLSLSLSLSALSISFSLSLSFFL